MADKLIVDCITGETKEQNFTPEEIAQREQESQNYTVSPEPVDEEKAAMAEAIIDLETRLSEMEVKINA